MSYTPELTSDWIVKNKTYVWKSLTSGPHLRDTFAAPSPQARLPDQVHAIRFSVDCRQNTRTTGIMAPTRYCCFHGISSVARQPLPASWTKLLTPSKVCGINRPSARLRPIYSPRLYSSIGVQYLPASRPVGLETRGNNCVFAWVAAGLHRQR